MKDIKIRDIITCLEEHFPLSLQEKWDNSGLQIGDIEEECKGVLSTLDITEEIIHEAHRRGCNLIIAHHPLLFHAVKFIGKESYIERCIRLAIKFDIAIYAAHTNADSAYNGLNYYLGGLLGLDGIEVLSPNLNDKTGLGVIGSLKEATTLPSLLQRVASIFSSKQVHYNQHKSANIKKVAICGGSGAFLYEEARRKGADVLITGEAKYNDYFDAEGITLITIGHYESEYPIVNLFKRILSEAFPTLPNYITEINHNPINIL